MRENRLKRMMREGAVALGPFVKLPSPALIEIMGHAGFDFVILDMEHGPLGYETVENLIRATELVNITPVVRVTENKPSLILRALDVGAQCVEVPHISNKEDAESAVAASKFSPEGHRGVCPFVRAAGYSSIDRFKHFESSNLESMVIGHIEGMEGVRNIDEILTVKGFDIAFIGPYDLSQSLGIPGQVNHPMVTERMTEVVEKAKKRSVAVGTFVTDAETAKRWIEAGVQFVSYSVDVRIFHEACRAVIGSIRV